MESLQSDEFASDLEALCDPEALKEFGSAQRGVSDAERRRAIERRAMEAAKAYYASSWPEVFDVSAKRPYDLLCRRGSDELHVEVKGTTSKGAAIILTRNEVLHARQHAVSTSLYVLSGIRLDAHNNASGGVQRIIEPWRPDDHLLDAVAFECILAADDEDEA